MVQISEQQAYAAMYAFLEYRYRLAESDELGSLLGSMSLLPGGNTADPAIWGDWLVAIKKATSNEVCLDMALNNDSTAPDPTGRR